MQEQFEFNAPKVYHFLSESKQRDPKDFSIDLTDSNDYWFMVTHVEVSPQKELHSDDENQSVEQLIQHEPIRRQPPQKSQQVRQEVQPSQQVSDIAPANVTRPKGKITRRTEPPSKPLKAAVALPERPFKKIAIDKLRHNDRISNKLTEEAEGRVIRRNMSMGQLTKSRKDETKDIRPCPFPPRIQREWEKKSKRDWYSLSPDSKLEAEKRMGELKQSKEIKGNPQKKKEKKEVRFRF